MVTITASYVVTPNQETPEGCFWLAGGDYVVRSCHIPIIYLYKGKHNYDVIERMRDSLSKVLVYYYPLAGRLSLTEDGRMKVDCNSKGVVLLEAKSTKTLAEYGDFSPTEPIKELLPAVDYSQPIEDDPLFLAQLTRFRDDEGMAIGVAVSHPLCDGSAFIRFINTWAKVARGDALGPDEMPFLDRTILKSSDPPLAPRFDHREFKPLPLKIGSSDHTTERQRKMTYIQLKLTPKQVEKLRMNANSGHSKAQGSRSYSRFEAIGAHIWICASKAHDLDENQPSLVKFNGDIRSRLNPPLPQNYFGNALAPVVTPTCCVGEIISKPPSYAAQKIREAVDMLTDEYIRSQLDFIAQQKQMDFLRPSFSQQERRNVPFYGNPNISLTSWTSLPVYEADFGWGKPVHFGHAAISPYDRATIVQGPDGDGSVVVLMNFQVVHIEKFIKFFWEDIHEDGEHSFKEEAVRNHGNWTKHNGSKL